MRATPDRIRGLPVAVILLLWSVACAPVAPATSDPSQLAAYAREHGIAILALRRTADGYMLDFRYRVIDPQRSRAIFSHRDKPYLIHEATGARFAVPSSPKIGPLRQMPRNPEAGRNYFMFFANPGKFVQVGDRVTVVIGTIRFEHIQVE